MGDRAEVIPNEIKELIMDFLKSKAFKIIIVIICLVGALLSVWVFKMGDDNPIEQLAEEVIKEEIGVDIDFTPKSGGK